MSNPFSGSDFSGANSMSDPLGFIKNLWGSMNIPGMVAPPMSLDELDKKIKDLKTVESWLTVNMNMLRGTIQALEVQRATIAALQSLGESFAQHAQQATASAAPASAYASPSPSPSSSSTEATNQSSNADWPMPAGSHKIPEPAVEDEEDEDEDEDIDMPPEHIDPASSAAPEVAKATENSAKTHAEAATQSADASAPFATPAAWWGLLQDQFKQAVSKALESEPGIAQSVATATNNADNNKKPAASKKASDKPATATKSKPKATTKTVAKAVTKTAPAKAKPVSKAAASTVIKASVKPPSAPKKTAGKPVKK
ncbi:PhaM family polyhydroxyalkanoate granule multifunctional regulatory protein [Undibacterium sp. SXout20W]|uniref:PhaM family polyhydroxyalkanoate granule multifunctional regulatory protein n=1 Tax=Undibacterium sp. SXout20W TaxID=3413051 RepID=UPI003BF34EEA